MDACSAEAPSATLYSVEKQLTLLTALLTTTLIAVIAAFVIASCKSLQGKRRVLLSLISPAEESSKDRGELVVPISSTSGLAVQSDNLYFSKEMVKYTTSITPTMPVQRVSTDKGELVVS